MPSILIEVRRPCSDAEASAMIDAVHAALMDAFKTPAWDKNVRFVEHAPQRFAALPRSSDPQRYVQVTMDCFPGRSPEAKRALHRGIAERLGSLGIPADCVQTLLRESSPLNWGIRGVPASELDLGFSVNV